MTCRRAWAAAHEFWSSAALFAGLLRPRPALARAVAAARAAAGLGGAPRPWIGAHVRRGDSCREGAYMGRTCSGGAAYAREACGLGARYGFGTLVVATDSDAALAELRAALPACGWPASAPVVATPAAARGGRQDGAKSDARIEDLMAAGVVDAAEEFAAVLVDVTLELWQQSGLNRPREGPQTSDELIGDEVTFGRVNSHISPRSHAAACDCQESSAVVASALHIKALEALEPPHEEVRVAQDASSDPRARDERNCVVEGVTDSARF